MVEEERLMAGVEEEGARPRGGLELVEHPPPPVDENVQLGPTPSLRLDKEMWAPPARHPLDLSKQAVAVHFRRGDSPKELPPLGECYHHEVGGTEEEVLCGDDVLPHKSSQKSGM